MKYINLGNTDIKVSRLCVGCMSYGKPSEDFHLWTTPYSPLADGHLCHTGLTSGSKRSDTDKSIRQKYDASKDNDLQLSTDDIAFLEEPYRAHEVVDALDKSLSLENVMPKK